MKRKKKYSEGTKQFLDLGFMEESQITTSPLNSIVAKMKRAKANGTFDPGMIDTDFHEFGAPLADSIEIACQILQLAADTKSLVVMTFPSPHRIMRFEAELRRLQYRPLLKGNGEPPPRGIGDGIAASTKEGWVMYSFMTLSKWLESAH